MCVARTSCVSSDAGLKLSIWQPIPTRSARNLRCTPPRASAQPVDTSSSNVSTFKRSSRPATNQKLLLQQEMQRLLAQEDAWHQDPTSPSNIVAASSPRHVKKILQAADPDSVVILDFFAPHCRACRGMWGAKKKLAATNPDVTFVKINTANAELSAMAAALNVTHMPWFIIMRGGSSNEQVASFTANLDTFDVLRAELAGAKSCPNQRALVSSSTTTTAE